MSNDTTQHTPADVRELVAREVFALDDSPRREYWDQFRLEFPRQSQVYYDTADRILALLRPPRGDEEAWRAFLDAVDEVETAAANLWADPAGPTAEDIERLGRARERVIECGRALASIRSEAQGEDRWEDLVFGPIVQAYNEAYSARQGEGGGNGLE